MSLEFPNAHHENDIYSCESYLYVHLHYIPEGEADTWVLRMFYPISLLSVPVENLLVLVV